MSLCFELFFHSFAFCMNHIDYIIHMYIMMYIHHVQNSSQKYFFAFYPFFFIKIQSIYHLWKRADITVEPTKIHPINVNILFCYSLFPQSFFTIYFIITFIISLLCNTCNPILCMFMRIYFVRTSLVAQERCADTEY